MIEHLSMQDFGCSPCEQLTGANSSVDANSHEEDVDDTCDGVEPESRVLV